MQRVIFYTFAYNARRTLPQTINSVIMQTCPDWTWYLVDNGSTDDTGKIIREYAGNDARIIPLANRQNHVWEPGNSFGDVVFRHDDDDFLCFLDADDAYKPDFLSKMLAFASANQLDVAACGNDFVNAGTGKINGARMLDRTLILEGAQFSEYFPLYHQYMRTTWGKLYRISVIKKVDKRNLVPLSYGGDTLIVTECFRNASRIGIYAESLYDYFVSGNSVSYQFDKMRIESDRILHEAAHKFLNDKCGFVNPVNEDFLLCVYMNALHDTMNVLVNARIPLTEKITGVIDITTHRYTGQLMAQRNLGIGTGSVAAMLANRRAMFSAIKNWLTSLDEVPDELVEGYCNAGELLSAAVEDAEGWLFFKKLRVRFLLGQSRRDEARGGLTELTELIPDDMEVAEFLRLF